MRSPFSLYVKKLKSGPVWYARFYDPQTEKYSISRSTGIPCTGKKGRRIEAYKAAEKILEALDEEKAPYFVKYLESFWKADSKYVKFKKVVEKTPISSQYIYLNSLAVKDHVKPYMPFQKIRLSELKPGMIEDWKIWALEKGTGSRRVNATLNCMKVATRYAVARGDLLHDPFLRIKKVAYTPREKGVLNQEEVGKLIDSQENDQRVKLAILLAVLSGMRRGEVRGLRWMDIDWENNLINVQNNYEPHRLFRRHNYVRGLCYGKENQVFQRGSAESCQVSI